MNAIYDEYYVNGKSASFIKKLWVLNNSENHLPILNKGVPPNGCFTMSIIQGNGLNVKHKDKTIHLSEGIYFCGPLAKWILNDIMKFRNTGAVALKREFWDANVSNDFDYLVFIKSSTNSELLE